jgi:hypothetical protein
MQPGNILIFLLARNSYNDAHLMSLFFVFSCYYALQDYKLFSFCFLVNV